MYGLKISKTNFSVNEVPCEQHRVCDEEAAGHQRWRGQPQTTIAGGVEQRIGLFRAKTT